MCVWVYVVSLFEDPFLKSIQKNVNLFVTYGGAIENRTDSFRTFMRWKIHWTRIVRVRVKEPDQTVWMTGEMIIKAHNCNGINTIHFRVFLVLFALLKSAYNPLEIKYMSETESRTKEATITKTKSLICCIFRYVLWNTQYNDNAWNFQLFT